MNFIRYLLLGLFCVISTLHAEESPLKIGIDGFLPPFVMKGKNNENYGFDVEMMHSLCNIMKRRCEFHTMKFAHLLFAVENREVDVALSYITITPERVKRVNFSNPYLLSYSRFLTKYPSSGVKPPFSLELLENKNIGVVSGTIFTNQIKTMGIKNPTITEYSTNEHLLESLSKDEVDFVLVDNPTAAYWEANSSGKIYAAGPSFVYGYGVGIAVNLQDKALLNAINKALIQYHNSSDFKNNYDKFIKPF